MNHKLIITDNKNKVVFSTEQKQIKNDTDLKKILKEHTEK